MARIGPGAMYIGLHGGVYSQCPKLVFPKHGFQQAKVVYTVSAFIDTV